MAAAIRCATNKLAGQAAQQRLLPRLVHDASATPVSTSNAAPSPTIKIRHQNVMITEELGNKKEDLYNLLAQGQWDRNYPNFIERYRNIKLLHQLSRQVEPRPDDPDWRIQRKVQVINVFSICVASVVTANACWSMLRLVGRKTQKETSQ